MAPATPEDGPASCAHTVHGDGLAVRMQRSVLCVCVMRLLRSRPEGCGLVLESSEPRIFRWEQDLKVVGWGRDVRGVAGAD